MNCVGRIAAAQERSTFFASIYCRIHAGRDRVDETSFKGSLPARGAAKHSHPAAVARQQQPVPRAQLASRCTGRSSFCSVERCKTLELGPAACEVAKLRIGRGVAGDSEKFVLCRRWGSPGAERLDCVGACEAVHCGSQRQETSKQHLWRRHLSVCLAPHSGAVVELSWALPGCSLMMFITVPLSLYYK